MLASEQAQQQDDEVRAAFEGDLQATPYQADRAGKQFNACDPGNRLVAGELERRWNVALGEVRSIESRLAEQTSGERPTASVEEFAELAEDLGAVWNDPRADASIKKRILRTLIEEIAVDTDPEAGEIVLAVHWKRGVHTELRVPRQKRGYVYPTSVEAIDAVRSLARACTDDVIAGGLNRNGLRTGRGQRWTRERITHLRGRNAILSYNRQRCNEEDWLMLKEAADIVGVSTATLRLAIERGEIPGEHPPPRAHGS